MSDHRWSRVVSWREFHHYFPVNSTHPRVKYHPEPGEKRFRLAPDIPRQGDSVRYTKPSADPLRMRLRDPKMRSARRLPGVCHLVTRLAGVASVVSCLRSELY